MFSTLPSPYLTGPEAAAYARVSRTTISRAISRGELRAARTSANGRVRIKVEWVDEWLEHGRAARMVERSPG
jgi:excisionase family DNA binding protein